MKNKKEEEGQALIEFILTMTLTLAFVLFFVQLSLLLAWGNYVQYATFMAARAYLSGGTNEDDQRDRAAAVLTRMVKKSSGSQDRVPFIAVGFGEGDIKGALIGKASNFDALDRDLSWLEGVRYTFRGRLFLLPVSNGQSASANMLTLSSESWLGREPTYRECVAEELVPKMGIFDNGC